MATKYETILSTPPERQEVSWTAKDLVIYALSVGFAEDPVDRSELPFVWEAALKPLPSYAAVATRAKDLLLAAQLDFSRIVQLGQETQLGLALPSCGRAVVESRIIEAVDKGQKGAVITMTSTLRDATSGALYATTRQTVLARGDRNIGGPAKSDTSAPVVPDRAPDISLDVSTSPNQALIYRLNGDLNPIHIDPDAAVAAGFERPILHGLCTYAIALRVVLKLFAGYRPEAVRSHGVRFAGPVFPGEVLKFDLWRKSDTVLFEVRSRDRSTPVLRNGRTELA